MFITILHSDFFCRLTKNNKPCLKIKKLNLTFEKQKTYAE